MTTENEYVHSYIVKTMGCDDQATISIVLTDSEAAAVRKVAAELGPHSGGCKPGLHITPYADATAYDIAEANHEDED